MVFKGEKGKQSQLDIKVRHQTLYHFPPPASVDRPAEFSRSSLDVSLPAWSTCKFAKKEVRGKVLVILQLNCSLPLLLIQERNQQYRQSTVDIQ